jgi:hypothetical protein
LGFEEDVEVLGVVFEEEVFWVLAAVAVLAVVFAEPFFTMVFLGPSVVGFFPEVLCEVLAVLPAAFVALAAFFEEEAVLAAFFAGVAEAEGVFLAEVFLVEEGLGFSEVLTEVFWEVF